MTEPVRKNQPLRLHRIRIECLRLSFDEVHVIADAYSGGAAAQQFGDRQVAALIRSNDNFPGGEASCAISDGIRTLSADVKPRRRSDTAFAAVIQIRDRDKIPVGLRGRQSGDARRLLAGTQHHDAPFQKIEIGQPREGYPGSNNAQQPCQYRCFCKTQSGSGNIIKSSVKVQFVKRYDSQKRDECDRDLNRHNSKIGERFVVIKPTQRHNANRQQRQKQSRFAYENAIGGNYVDPAE